MMTLKLVAASAISEALSGTACINMGNGSNNLDIVDGKVFTQAVSNGNGLDGVSQHAVVG